MSSENQICHIRDLKICYCFRFIAGLTQTTSIPILCNYECSRHGCTEPETRRDVCFVEFARWRHRGEVCRLRLHLVVFWNVHMIVTFRIYGFYDECKRRYNIKLWKTFTDCFNCLPVGMCVCEFITATAHMLYIIHNKLVKLKSIFYKIRAKLLRRNTRKDYPPDVAWVGFSATFVFVCLYVCFSTRYLKNRGN